jgi:hypothetical protein
MTNTIFRSSGLGVLVAFSIAMPASAQMASASTAALAMGDNFTAAARSLNAVAWNPAGLGLRGGELPSLTLLTMRGSNGIAPITLSDLTRFAGDIVPADIKANWIARIEATGGQTGSGSLEATWGAFHVGRFGAQFSSSSRVMGDLSPGIARLVMFGNADENGDPQALDFDGSSFDLQAWSTAGVSYAQPIQFSSGRLSIGVTAKYSWGHLLASGGHSTGGATADPVSVTLVFPVVQTILDSDSMSLDSGRGFGLDVGAAWQSGIWTFAAVAKNVVSQFEWQVADMRYRPLSLSLDGGTMRTETGVQPLSSAPGSVQQMVADLDFKKVYALGAAATPSPKLLLTADARFSGNGGMLAHPSRHVGAGVQYRLLSWLPVRAGAAAIALEQEAGYQLGSGFGLDIGGWNVSASGSRRSTRRFGTESALMFTLFGTGLR